MNRGAVKRSPSLSQMSTTNVLQISPIETPSPTGANTLNRPAQASQSLYQLSLDLINRLYCVEGFEQYLDQDTQNDTPVGLLWQTFRLGYPLCMLFNAMKPGKPIAEEFCRPNMGDNKETATKKMLYQFSVGCKNELDLNHDETFTVSAFTKDDTDGLVKVINAVKRILDRMEAKNLLIPSRRQVRTSEPIQPTDSRARVVNEILETERKYVQDLEALQTYSNELIKQEIISADTNHKLFANLNHLVDFQRRFLIGIEDNAAKPPADQRFGLLFIEKEDSFEVYEPFCANYQYASELAIQETDKLQKLKHVVEPTYELPSLLIKPIQRICKYPLLLQELLKYSDQNETLYYSEIERGLKAIKRVADRVNETRRKQENEAVVKELERRVEDWKGHSVSSFGVLLLEDVFIMSKDDSEREYHVYLFEKILLCCKEMAQRKPQTPGRSLLTQRRPKRASLQLKGRIFIHNISAVVNNSRSGLWSLKVFWRGDTEMESFSLKCRNEEQLKQWQSTLEKLVTDQNSSNRHTLPAQMSKPIDVYIEKEKRTPVSNTQLVSLQNLTPNSYYGRDDDAASYIDPDEDEEEEDEEVERRDNEEEEAGKGELEGEDGPESWSSNKARSQSLPYGQMPRNRARDDQYAQNNWQSVSSQMQQSQSQYYSQYRPHHGNMSMPPPARTGLPAIPGSITTMLPNASAKEYNGPNYLPLSPPPSHPNSPAQSVRSSGSANSQSLNVWPRRSSDHPQSSFTDTIARFMTEPVDEYAGAASMQRTHSHNPPVYQQVSNPVSHILQSPMKMRSQSNPNIHTIQESSQETAADMPFAPHSQYSRTGNGYHASSQSTVSSSNSSYNIPSAMTTPSSSNISLVSSTMKIKVNFADDIFVIVVPSDIKYRDLCERVEKKIGLSSRAAHPLKIKYPDDEGDHITMSSDEDVRMAFEDRSFLNLYVI